MTLAGCLRRQTCTRARVRSHAPLPPSPRLSSRSGAVVQTGAPCQELRVFPLRASECAELIFAPPKIDSSSWGFSQVEPFLKFIMFASGHMLKRADQLIKALIRPVKRNLEYFS